MTYPGSGAARPHAVSAVTGTVNGVVNPTYTYDANGNLLFEKEGAANRRAIVWESFNLPQSIAYTPAAGTGATATFWYGPAHERVKQQLVEGGTTTTTFYLHGPHYEEATTGGTTTKRAYVHAGGRIVALAETVGASTTLTYYHGDHLGSTSIVTNASGAVVGRMSYDAWGKRRHPDGTDGNPTPVGNRGYTGHEHLDKVFFVHMNGRVYDPALGRFISADPVIDEPQNSQAYNRYSYVANNPLTYIDPTGYFKLKKLFRLAAAVAIATFAPQMIANAYVGGITATATSASQIVAAVWAAPTVGAVGAGFASGVVLTGTMEGGLQGALTAGLFSAAAGVGEANSLERAFAHAAAGCASAVAGGGHCGRGALSAGFAKYGSENTPKLDNLIYEGVRTAVIGGTASVLGGGKFENGAGTAAYGYLFNHLPHLIGRLQTLYYRVAPYAERVATVAEALALAVTGTPSPSSVLMPRGNPIGWIEGGADDLIRTVSKTDFDKVVGNLLNQSQEVVKQNFPGRWFKLADDAGEWGLRVSSDSGATLQLMVKGVPFSKLHYRPSLADQVPK